MGIWVALLVSFAKAITVGVVLYHSRFILNTVLLLVAAPACSTAHGGLIFLSRLRERERESERAALLCTCVACVYVRAHEASASASSDTCRPAAQQLGMAEARNSAGGEAAGRWLAKQVA